LIRERFDLYYVGLFLVDGTRQWALLQAGTGPAGQALRARGHVLPVNADSNVGWSIVNDKPRVVQAGSSAGETQSLASDELPNTRSQATLPLRSRGRVIGALDVHSVQSDAFDATAQAALQGMADQVAVALDNARLFAESQAALEAERRAYGQMGREVWSQLLRAGATPGYGYAGDQVVQIGNEWTPEMETALREQKSVATSQAKPALALPIKVRGQTIGVVDLRKDDEHSVWTPDEVRLIETLTDQLGVALEGARLYQDTQRRAAREQAINVVTANVRSEATVNAILQRTAQELGRTFGAARTTIKLELNETP
jgi:GAF domain-containing protein